MPCGSDPAVYVCASGVSGLTLPVWCRQREAVREWDRVKIGETSPGERERERERRKRERAEDTAEKKRRRSRTRSPAAEKPEEKKGTLGSLF